MKKARLVNPFTDEAYLVLGTAEDYRKYVFRLDPKYSRWSEGAANGRCENPSSGDVEVYLVWIDRNASPRDRRLVVVHECVHLVMQIFKSCGIPIEEHNDETFAYVHGYFCEQIFKLLRL